MPTATLHGSKGSGFAASVVVDAMKSKCPTVTGRVRLDVVQGDAHLRPTFACQIVRDDGAGAASELVDLVANRHDAAHRADLVISLTRELGISPYGRDDLIWSIGTGLDGCYRVADAGFHRQEIGEVAHLPPPRRETPVHWTKVEAARFAGTCPDQLGAFFDSVAAAGQPAAANEVRSEMARLGVPS